MSAEGLGRTVCHGRRRAGRRARSAVRCLGREGQKGRPGPEEVGGSPQKAEEEGTGKNPKQNKKRLAERGRRVVLRVGSGLGCGCGPGRAAAARLAAGVPRGRELRAGRRPAAVPVELSGHGWSGSERREGRREQRCYRWLRVLLLLFFPYLYLTREDYWVIAPVLFFFQVTTPENLCGSSVLKHKLCVAALEAGLMLPPG